MTRDLLIESNALVRMMKKLKYLKEKIRMWNKLNKEKSHKSKRSLLAELADCDAIIDKGEGENNVINRRTEVVNLLQEVKKKNSLEAAQKWAIEGDENSKYYHGVINKKRNRLSIRGTWIDSPSLVKSEFLSHFKNRFEQPNSNRLHMNMHFSNTLSSVQVADLECQVSKEEIKKTVWDCGIDKSPGPDGFTFGFYHRPISLIGSMYKIISKILANRLVVVLGGLVNEIQSTFVADKQILDGPFILNELVQWCKKKKKQSLVFKVDFEKAYDSVRWDHLDDIMRKFGFGEKWCMWIQSCLRFSKGSVIVNGSLAEEFQIYKGLKQGDLLSPFLFILVMESLHISFQRVVDVVLDCLNRASGLRINMTKRKLLGISVEDDKVKQAAAKIGCNTLKTPFSYLGSKVGGCMSRIQSWNETIERMACRLSKWKLKTLLIGGSGEFSTTSVRKMIDVFMLPEVSSKTRWIKAVPIKVNVHAWKVKLDGLPTRLNISRRGIDIESILCPMCGKAVESTSHIFFTCQMSKEILRKISRWWDIDYMEISSYEEWLDWILNMRLSVKSKLLFEGVCYVLWWHVWSFRNKTIFGSQIPSKAMIFDDVVSRSFYWCRYRCKVSFSWIEWLKKPHLISL
uniref:RNA-directed DNA polymerase, eukaryota n=1 Tax=Tanacetum cinerariifolium TaxID=118510 RepID=A0A6L2J953_TANCI|nr:RNA-directed DNA polymerase, eukaryota [Tanacetum cinerariifolium]